ncbi:V-type ATP synthase subunit E [Halobacteriales archaeon QS_6_64_34]|nr:MAG: V-type ATP synthase subunit E [Halobacteriales archaeon QS_6_64_34]
MSLETVVEDIRDEARARAEKIRADGEEHADGIIAEAEADAAEIREEREAEVEREIAQEREQRLSSAKLEAKQARLGARRDVLEDVRDDVEAAIADLEGDRREELTRELLAAAAEEFGDNELRIYGRAGDQSLIEDILTEYDDATFAGERECLGGVVVESEASRVRVNNTFDSVLESVWEENLKAISDRLFDDQ